MVTVYAAALARGKRRRLIVLSLILSFFQQAGLLMPEADIGGREVLQTLVITSMIVMADELINLSFKVAGPTKGFWKGVCAERVR